VRLHCENIISAAANESVNITTQAPNENSAKKLNFLVCSIHSMKSTDFRISRTTIRNRRCMDCHKNA